jgi:hypothetical protein
MTTKVQFIPANEATPLRLAMTPGATIQLGDEEKARIQQIDEAAASRHATKS